MKKKICFALAIISILATMLVLVGVVFADELTEDELITITYVKSASTMSATTDRDTKAYDKGKQAVKPGEKFTLPTTSSVSSHVGEEGYQLLWYTEDGRTFKGGDTVSFDKDTKLFRCCAKEVYTAAELGMALCGDTKSGILMADIEANSAISFPSWDTGVIIMNGFDINFNTNATGLIGEMRTQRHFYGEGTINVTNPDGKVGEYYVLKATNHGYAGDNSRTVIGRDVTINAPNHYLTGYENGDVVNHYVWTRIYGTINCYGLLYRPSSANASPYTEFYDGCNVTFTGERLFWDVSKNKFNHQAFDTVIYGGTFNLPAAAANQSFWTNDYLESFTNHDGTITYTNLGLTQNTKDNIIIYGGSFVTADGSVPAIADYIANTYAGSFKTGGSGIQSNIDTSTYEVPYKIRPGIKLEFTTYSSSSLGTITVTDYIGSSLNGRTFKYTVNTLENGNLEIVVYESRMDGETEVWDVVSDELAIKYGLGGTILVSYDLTRESLKLHSFEANNTVYQTVVSATCDHKFESKILDATCQSIASASYNCSKCGCNLYFCWGEKASHTYEAISTVLPTASTLGETSFACSVCGYEKTYATTQDPTNFEVAVTIRNDDGTFNQITALAADIFEFSTNGDNGAYIYTLTGIKAFGEYNIRNIYGVKIPCGIMYVKILTHNYEKYEDVEYGLEILEISENSAIAIQNIGNLSSLKTIKVGKGSNAVFESNVTKYNVNNENRITANIETIDFSAGNSNIMVMSSAFKDRPIKNLLLGENSTYDFRTESFRNIQITELKIPSMCSLILGSNAFRNAGITSLAFPDGTPENISTWKFGDEAFLYNPITSIEFGQYGIYTFGTRSFANMKLAGELIFAANSTYTINSLAFSNNEFTRIDFSAGNVNLTVNGSGLKNLTNVTELKFGENSTYTFNGESIGTTTYTKLTLAANSSYAFKESFLKDNKIFEEIDASAENITILFDSKCFNGISTLKTITFGENPNLTFKEDCLKDTAITDLILPERATLTFNDKGLRNFAITALEIKDGSTVTFASGAFKDSTVETLTLAPNSSYTFNNASLNYTTLFTEIVVPENCTVEFKDWALNSNSTITKIDLSANAINSTFQGSALKNTKSLTTLLINSNNATCVINNNAFNNTPNLATIRIDGENSSYTFNGKDVFKDIPNLKELTLGKNSIYTFGEWLVTGSTPLEKLDASADGVNVTFGQNSFRGRETLTTLLINGKNATYVLKGESFRDSKNISELVLGEGSTYTFDENAFSGVNKIERIDATASNVTATFGNNVFSGKSAIAYIAFGENSQYIFNYRTFYDTTPTNDIVFSNTSTFQIGKEAFRNTDFASITFEDNCNVEFTGIDAFNGCDKATSLYIGKNVAITNYPFKNLKALETLYIMEGVTHTSENEFSHAGAADYSTPLYIYNHSYDFEFLKGTFNECDGVFLYTVTDNIGTRTDVFSNCSDQNGYKAWTVYLGIPHPMVEGFISAPTCTEEGITGWVADASICDCGFQITNDTVVNKYEKKHNITAETEIAEIITYTVTIAAPLGHDYGVEAPVRLDWVYVNNNYFENAKNKHNCTVCGVDYLGNDIENSALFGKRGTSVAEFEKNAIAHTVFVNLDAVEAYNEFLGTGNEIKYGVVAGLATDGKPVNSDGSANGNAFVYAFTDTYFSILQIKLAGIKNENQGLYCCAYIIVGDTVSYLHNETVNQTATTVSIANPTGKESVVESVSIEAAIDTKEKIYA